MIEDFEKFLQDADVMGFFKLLITGMKPNHEIQNARKRSKRNLPVFQAFLDCIAIKVNAEKPKLVFGKTSNLLKHLTARSHFYVFFEKNEGAKKINEAVDRNDARFHARKELIQYLLDTAEVLRLDRQVKKRMAAAEAQGQVEEGADAGADAEVDAGVDAGIEAEAQKVKKQEGAQEMSMLPMNLDPSAFAEAPMKIERIAHAGASAEEPEKLGAPAEFQLPDTLDPSAFAEAPKSAEEEENAGKFKVYPKDHVFYEPDHESKVLKKRKADKARNGGKAKKPRLSKAALERKEKEDADIEWVVLSD